MPVRRSATAVLSIAVLAGALAASGGEALARGGLRHAATPAAHGMTPSITVAPTARSIDPARVLAGGAGAGAGGYAGRTANLASIMGAQAAPAPLRIPVRPERAARREADAAAGLR